MGNAATCQVCGSDRALKNHHADYYGAADSGSDADDPLVRDGERDKGYQLFFYKCCNEEMLC